MTTPPGPESPGYLPGPGGFSGTSGAESAGYLPGPGGLAAAPSPSSPGYLPGPGGLAAGGPNVDPASYPPGSSGAGLPPGREPSGFPSGPTGAAPSPSDAGASGYPSAHGGAGIPSGGESSGYPPAHGSVGHGSVGHGGAEQGSAGHGPAADPPGYPSGPGGMAPSAPAAPPAAEPSSYSAGFGGAGLPPGAEPSSYSAGFGGAGLPPGAEPSSYSAGFGGAGLAPDAEPPGYPAGPGPVRPSPASESPGYPGSTRSAAYPPRREALALPTAPTQPEPAYRYPEPAPAEPASRPADSSLDVLPQRVPAEPDVPTVPEPPAAEPPAETPELARIATHLRREDGAAQLHERPDGFDVNAILAAVRGVAGVRDASLRTTPAGAHSLRLDLSDGADPAEVSRQVARLLQERMGLAAAPQNLPGPPAAGPPGFGAPPSGAPTATYGSGPAGQFPAGPREAAPAPHTEPSTEEPRRRRQAPSHRGRAVVGEQPPGSPAEALRGAPAGTPGVSPGTAGTSYSGSQVTTTETAPSRPLNPGSPPGPRVIIDHVQVSTFGLDATVEVRLAAGEHPATGLATGPAVDGYVLRLCAVAAAAAVDELLSASTRVTERGRCFVEHAAVVPFGSCEVATVVVLLVCDGWVEQLAGSALVAGDPRQAVVRATLAAVNRRLEALLT
ncbi:hypothetical protein I0C86_02715 [Plantactinospora sp. S1510]|uniref:Roadblock/LAMTOR2 domain-containing protein n=1 Tax=Plantactinospora alkalitolerans TaxID=2789879 RepID=A0ABS0GNZ0_9ACTN|nr:hypothetical protein [Plantactinospora alkalitolerans]MBF9127916.1 hypothetical protein [Plantactinospora alkalitolerans]